MGLLTKLQIILEFTASALRNEKGLREIDE
jgi:hypothetical protein